MSIQFTIRLTQNDWDSGLFAWRCPALGIPSADVVDIFVAGNKIDRAKYEILSGQRLIRWIGQKMPEAATVLLELKDDLTTKDDTDRWKKLAIVLPVVGTVSGALISGYFSYEAAKARAPSAEPALASFSPPSGTQGSRSQSVAPQVQKLPQGVQFSLLMPRGNKVIVLWDNAPKVDQAEKVFRISGINLVDLDNALKSAYAAFAQRSPDAITFRPFFSEIRGEIEFGSGYSFFAQPQLNESASYGEFQLFGDEKEFKLLLHMKDNPDEPIPPEKSGINFSAVRAALQSALEILHTHERSFEVGYPALLRNADGSWEYRMEVRKRG